MKLLFVDCCISQRGEESRTRKLAEAYLEAYMNRHPEADLETVILPTNPALSMISSTYVRDLLKYGCELKGSVPDACLPLMEELYRRK